MSKCTFNGQQCCSPTLINFVDQGFRSLVQSDRFNFTSGLAGAQTAIDQMRDRTDGMYVCMSISLYLIHCGC